MSLIGAAKLSQNVEVRQRTEAAVRQIGYTKLNFPGAVGKLANAGLTSPDTVVAPFLWELAADGTVTETACPECGHSKASDDQIRYVVEVKWDSIAAKMFPDE